MQLSQLESESQTESIPETESAMEYSAIPSSDELMQIIASQNSNVGRYIVFDEETDLNELLGRPGEYIGKASFEDIRLEQTMIDAGYENDYTGGTFEIFSTAEDCQKRYDYLLSLRNSGSGPYGLQDYIYKYDTVLFRLSFDLTPDQADEYHNIFDTIMSNYQDISTQVSD